jgi:hypothetical protein
MLVQAPGARLQKQGHRSEAVTMPVTLVHGLMERPEGCPCRNWLRILLLHPCIIGSNQA